MVKLTDFKVSHYPDGHKHVVSDKDLHGDDTLEVSIKSFDDLFLAAQIKAIHPELTNLRINYMLAGRCDRRFSPGEAIDLKIVCDFIENMMWYTIYVVKPHSDETIKYLKQGRSAVGIIDPTMTMLDTIHQELGSKAKICYVCPDKGAQKFFDNKKFGNVITCSKNRNRETGRIDVKVPIPKDGCLSKYTHFIIVDDLCDGGGTFTAIAAEIKAAVPRAKVYLVVTHAIFSKGFEPFKGLIDRIICTNSFSDLDICPSFVTQIEI